MNSGAPHTAVALGLAAVGGLGAGITTSWLQEALSGDWNTLANSGAVWTLIAFALALSAPGRTTAVVAGLLALGGEVVGYYAIALPVRDVASSHAEVALWSAAALVIGPAAGLAAYYARCGRPGERLGAVLALCGVVAGESVYVLRVLARDGTGLVGLVLAGGVACAAVLRSAAQLRLRVLAVAGGAVVAGAVYVAYADPLWF